MKVFHSRRRRVVSLASTGLIAMALVVAAGGQVSPPTPPRESVTLPFFAADEHGNLVNISLSDITVTDDGKPAQSIAKVGKGTELPLRIGLLIDTSGSERSSALYSPEVKAASPFVGQQLSGKDAGAFVITFSDTPSATNWVDGEQLPTLKIDVRPSGGTSLYDALYVACHDRFAKVASDVLQRRVIILITDGEDDASHFSGKEVFPYVQRGGVIVFAISTAGRRTPERGRKFLENLTTATGGQAFFPENPDEIPSAFTSIGKELDAMQYVTFVPEELNVGKYHEVRLTVGSSLRVRTPEGYFAEKKSSH